MDDVHPCRENIILAISGFFLVLLEPIILLLGGDDIGGALWPHAIRALSWSFILRELHLMIFAISIVITGLVILKRDWKNDWKRRIVSLSIGAIMGLILIFLLLDIAYLRGAFILLPTAYGILLLNMLIINWGLPSNPANWEDSKVGRSIHILGIIFAVWLIAPGLSAMAGLSPSPPEWDGGLGPHEFTTEISAYTMPAEVESIRGEYEADITFSVYLTIPDVNGEMPLAIILHGFANPQFSTYEDWVAHLASRGMAVAFIQYPSDVLPEGHDTYVLHEEDGMANHPYHVPRAIALQAGLDHAESMLSTNVDTSNLLIGGHSLGAGYALMVMDWSLQRGWGNESLFIDLETPYARPVQDHLQIDTSLIPENFMAHIVISEDDMSVSDCFGVHHQALLGENALFIESPSDRYGFPRLVSSHYLQASETHDTLADWAFYRRVASQADWMVTQNENSRLALLDSDEFRYMGEWSDGTPVKELGVWDDALSSNEFDYCEDWTGGPD